jgi:hypothetical protein
VSYGTDEKVGESDERRTFGANTEDREETYGLKKETLKVGHYKEG